MRRIAFVLAVVPCVSSVIAFGQTQPVASRPLPVVSTQATEQAGSVIRATREVGVDVCAKIHSALEALQASGGTVDARDFTTNQSCSSDPFASITKPFTLILPYTSIKTSHPWRLSGAQELVKSSVSGNPAQIVASESYPKAVITTLTATGKVVTVTTSRRHGFSPGEAVSITGTTDPSLEGVFWVKTATPTTFTYLLSVPDTVGTGGAASPPLVTIGTDDSNYGQPGTRLEGVYLDGSKEGLPVLFANINGQELSGIRDSVLVNFSNYGIYIAGPNANSGTGNTSYEHLVLAFGPGPAPDAVGICVSSGGGARYLFNDITLVANGTGRGRFAFQTLGSTTFDIRGMHVENYGTMVEASAGSYGIIQTLLGGAGVDYGVDIHTTGAIAVTFVSGTLKAALVNHSTGTTLKDVVFDYLYSGSSPRQEVYFTEPNEKGLVSTGLTLTGDVPTTSGSEVGLGNTTAFGNGIAGVPVTTTSNSSGGGPEEPQTIVRYLEVSIGGTNYWLPLLR
jgi:hypothetical protein